MGRIVDVAVVGAGAAGLSAALFLGRAGKSTVVYDGGPPRIYAVDRIREFPGFDGATPDEMFARLRGEVVQYGAEIRNAVVEHLDPREDGSFDVSTWDGTTTARTVVLATGLTDELPHVAGIQTIWGRDLRICPCFDGYEVRNQRFVVIGAPERLAHMGAWVSIWSPHVTIVSTALPGDANKERLRLLGINIVSDEVTGLVHQGQQLRGVSTASGEEISCDVVWVASGFRAASKLASSLCDVDERGFAKTDADGRTSRPGVFAVGNASNPIAHLAHAVASGTNVGPHVALYLLESLVQKLSSVA